MADYRSVKLAEQKVEWTGASGKLFSVSVQLNRQESDYFGNGDWQPVRDGLHITTSASIDGVDHADARNAGVFKLPKAMGTATHHIGKIAMSAAIAAQIAAARAAVKQAPEWAAKQAQDAASMDADRAYENRADGIIKMMGE